MHTLSNLNSKPHNFLAAERSSVERNGKFSKLWGFSVFHLEKSFLGNLAQNKFLANLMLNESLKVLRD